MAEQHGRHGDHDGGDHDGGGGGDHDGDDSGEEGTHGGFLDSDEITICHM